MEYKNFGTKTLFFHRFSK